MSDGDCFPKAVETLRLLLDQGLDAYIVHGTPTYLGDGPAELPDGRFHHAWVEVEGPDTVVVYDFSNGRERIVDRAMYYAVGNLTPETHTTEYDHACAVYQMTEFGHYGPWDGSVPPVAATG
jgi:hypothetical protein